MNASSIPMVVAVLALIGTIATPIITGRMNRNSPLTKAEAAETFTRIAASYGQDYEEIKGDLREIKLLLRELIREIDMLSPECASDEAGVHRVRDLVDQLRRWLY